MIIATIVEMHLEALIIGWLIGVIVACIIKKYWFVK